MTPLMSCPRCTQVLPTTAAYCRRCGGPVVPPRSQVPPTAGRRGWVGRVVAVIAVLGVGDLLLMSRATAPRSAPRSAPPVVTVHRGAASPAVRTDPPTRPPTWVQLPPTGYPPTVNAAARRGQAPAYPPSR